MVTVPLANCRVVGLTIVLFDSNSSVCNAPTSRAAPFTFTISATTPAVVVLSTQNYIVSLEGSPCSITVRHLFSNPVAHLVWVANYYTGYLDGSTQCTLTFTQQGDLQLIVRYRGSDTMICHSDTAGKGITKMALENVFDSGDFRLLTSNNNIIYHSFDVKEFAILPTEKFRPGETLVGPLEYFNDNVQQAQFSGDYTLKLQNGDLRLCAYFGAGEKLYWSLQKTLFQSDLSKVAYASIVPKVGGIGLFDQSGDFRAD